MKRLLEIVKDILLFVPAMIALGMMFIFLLFCKDDGGMDEYDY